MRMLDAKNARAVHRLQLYLTPREAAELRTALDRLLADPEANEHEHVVAEDAGMVNAPHGRLRPGVTLRLFERGTREFATVEIVT